ncbi:porin [Pseudoxanthomonas daejeonensis]|uniref:DcaP family trimeric outer membrane transporter n=1 Tax=Pseudoxanthomonas daejeonensis TaxID=266062 RepID=UPI001F548271|nr:DcaP family trimeric outer membrane transporter [Pseudoxanthomonas daejeonensis]UNK58317.1 porin [Pseudoxanthomonas daejeonensis]
MNGATLRFLVLVAALSPLSALAQKTDDERDAEIASLRETVDRLVHRIEVLESERGQAPATAGPGLPAPVAVAAAPVPPASATPVPVPAAADAALAAAPVPAPDESPLPAHPSFSEDELGGARVDNELAPGEDGQEGFFPVRGTSTWLRLSGYAKLDAMYDTDDAGVSDQFITSTIPAGDQAGDGSFNMHARQTRFTIEARRQTDYGWLRFVLQNDFYGSGGSYGYNLRHAWGQLGNTYVGYGFSAFLDLDSGPDTLDFAGPGAVPFARLASVRQYVPLSNGNQLVFAAEHAPPEITSSSGSARTTAPNLVFVARHEGESGHMQVGTLLRQLAYRDDAGSDEAMAGGITVSGAWGAEAGNYVTWGAVGGRGIATYVGDLGGIGLDAVVDDTGALEVLDEWGGWIGYGHPWNEHWRSTLTWGRLYLDRNDSLAPDAFRRSDYAAANVIYAPVPSWSWGLELVYGKLQQQDGTDGDAFRLQTSLKYDFIK